MNSVEWVKAESYRQEVGATSRVSLETNLPVYTIPGNATLMGSTAINRDYRAGTGWGPDQRPDSIQGHYRCR